MRMLLGLLFDVGLANESCAPSCGTCVLEIDFRAGDVRSFSKNALKYVVSRVVHTDR